MARRSPQSLFWSHVRFGFGCWRWTGSFYKDGYGQVGSTKFNSKRAHRVAYELLVGPIPEGMVLDHLCRHTWCQNPRHLEPVTHAENIRRGVGRPAQNARKTHCKNGHPFDRVNINGERFCSVCTREYQRRYYYEHYSPKRGA